MFINRGMHKGGTVHIYNQILLSHQKELNNIICSNRDVDLKTVIRKDPDDGKD